MIIEPRKDCIICETEIFRHHNSRSNKERRSIKSLTCSKRCAKIYNRIFQHIKCRTNVKREETKND